MTHCVLSKWALFVDPADVQYDKSVLWWEVSQSMLTWHIINSSLHASILFHGQIVHALYKLRQLPLQKFSPTEKALKVKIES